ncbi:MAG: HPr family phosphocarrier protein [Planctomycetes bacterium]|nr:HPr family phosphocarrier protein [Planctomycetota bacterium]
MIATSQRAVAVVRNQKGLHARPSTLIVEAALKFQADVYLLRGDLRANAKKLLDVLSLGAEQGAIVTLEAAGPDAEEAILTVKGLVETEFSFDS